MVPHPHPHLPCNFPRNFEENWEFQEVHPEIKEVYLRASVTQEVGI